MKSDMKLIMESWRARTLLETSQTPTTVGEFKTAWLAATSQSKITAKDEEEYIKLYQKVNKARPSRQNIKNGMALISVLTTATAMFAAPPAAPALVVKGAALSATLSTAAIWIAELLENREEKKLENKKVTRIILSILGIDEKLLATIENDVEDDFYMKKVQPDFQRWINTADPDEPMPNYGVMFRRFLNRDQLSPLSSSPTAKIADK